MSDYGRAMQGEGSDFPEEMKTPSGSIRLSKNDDIRLSDRLNSLDESITRLRESLSMLLDKLLPVMRPEGEDEKVAMKESAEPHRMSEVASLIDDYRSQIRSLERLIHRHIERIEL